MPELPEAETIARDLDRLLPGTVVKSVAVHQPDILAPGLSAARLGRALRGRRILRVGRRAKAVVIEFDDATRLMFQLGMTGRLAVTHKGRGPDFAHIAARARFDDGRELLFDDIRRFGRITLLDPAAWDERSLALGIEPLSDEFTAERFHRMTRASITPIRNFLLDQKRIAGIGNIYANEALFRARVRPTRRARTLTRAETERLRNAIRDVLRDAITSRGTTLSDYRDGNGERGGFQFRLQVYDREGLPCPVCRTPIKRIVLTNRSAFYCPRCQR